MTDIPTIAAGLTENMRECVLSASQTVGGAYVVWHSHLSTIKAVHKRGLCTEPSWQSRATETPLGLAVREYLKEQER